MREIFEILVLFQVIFDKSRISLIIDAISSFIIKNLRNEAFKKNPSTVSLVSYFLTFESEITHSQDYNDSSSPLSKIPEKLHSLFLVLFKHGIIKVNAQNNNESESNWRHSTPNPEHPCLKNTEFRKNTLRYSTKIQNCLETNENGSKNSDLAEIEDLYIVYWNKAAELAKKNGTKAIMYFRMCAHIGIQIIQVNLMKQGGNVNEAQKYFQLWKGPSYVTETQACFIFYSAFLLYQIKLLIREQQVLSFQLKEKLISALLGIQHAVRLYEIIHSRVTNYQFLQPLEQKLAQPLHFVYLMQIEAFRLLQNQSKMIETFKKLMRYAHKLFLMHQVPKFKNLKIHEEFPEFYSFAICEILKLVLNVSDIAMQDKLFLFKELLKSEEQTQKSNLLLTDNGIKLHLEYCSRCLELEEISETKQFEIIRVITEVLKKESTS